MLIYRFMSKKEFQYYLCNCIISPTTEGLDISKGGIYFMEQSWRNDAHKGVQCQAEIAYEFMSGCVSDEICAIFKVSDDYVHKKTSGIYADPYSSLENMCVDEILVESYHISNFRLMSFCKDVKLLWKPIVRWEWINIEGDVK